MLGLARKHAKEGDFSLAEKEYCAFIDLLRSRATVQDVTSLVELFSTQAEYCNAISVSLIKEQKFEAARRTHLDALRLLYACSKLSNEDSIIKNLETMKKHYLVTYGCVIPEDENFVYLQNCIVRHGAGLGPKLAPSIGMFIKKLECSVCNKEPFECEHQPGQEYEGVRCKLVAKEIGIDHIALVENPKDPYARITQLRERKDKFLEKLIKMELATREEIAKKEQEGTPLICNLCRNRPDNAEKIGVEDLFSIQEITLTCLDSYKEPLFENAIEHYSIKK